MERIGIHFDVELDYEPNDEWHRLEEVLIKSGWPELKWISITVTFVDQSATAVFGWGLSLDRQFLRLRGSKQLDFQFSVVSDDESDR